MSDLREERMRGLGGTDSPVVLGVSPWKTRRELWMEKRGLLEEREETGPMKRGKALEPLIIQEYQEQTSRVAGKCDMLTHPQHPYMIAHPDGIILEPGKPPGVLEVKCLGLRSFSRTKREGLPLAYTLQLQHYLAFPDFSWGSFAIFNADLWEMVHFDVQADPELQASIIEADAEFWDAVQAGEMPEDDAPKIDLPPATPSEISKVDSPEWREAIDRLREARSILEDAESFAEEAKVGIEQMMNGASIVEGFGARIYYTEQKGRVSLDAKRIRRDHPEIDWAKYEKQGAPFKTFRPYFLRGGGGNDE